MDFWEQTRVDQPELRKREQEEVSWQRAEWLRSHVLCMARMYSCVVWVGIQEEAGLVCAPLPPTQGACVPYYTPSVYWGDP